MCNNNKQMKRNSDKNLIKEVISRFMNAFRKFNFVTRIVSIFSLLIYDKAKIKFIDLYVIYSYSIIYQDLLNLKIYYSYISFFFNAFVRSLILHEK